TILYNGLGLVYIDKGDIDEAFNCHTHALHILGKTELIPDIHLSNTYNNLGTVYFNKNNLDKSLEYHMKALNIREQLKKNDLIAMSYNHIGNIYS
ncbi:unnamed protein product, partial [Didymodactylos carnosus]